MTSPADPIEVFACALRVECKGPDVEPRWAEAPQPLKDHWIFRARTLLGAVEQMGFVLVALHRPQETLQ